MLESFSKGHKECIEGVKIDSVIQLQTFANGVIPSVPPGEIDTTARLCTKGLKEEMGKRIQKKQKQSDLLLARQNQKRIYAKTFFAMLIYFL